MKWKNEPVLFIDTETTGPDPDTARVVELAMVLMLEGEILWSCTWLVNPEVPIPEGASAVHGIHDADVQDAPIFDDILDLVGLAMDHRFCGAYNVPYDKTVLRGEFARVGAGLPNEFWVDSLVLSREFVTIRGRGVHKLDTMSQRLGIDLGEDAHTATADAVAAGKILWHYVDKLPDDANEFALIHAQWAANQRAEWVAYCKRVNRDPGKEYK